MTRIKRSFLASSCIALGASLAAACGPATEASQATTEASRVDSRTATYTPIPGGGTASRAVLWGDPDTGPAGAFVKFLPGEQANPGLHTHSSDGRIVVLEGAYLYRPESGPEQRVGPGQFLFIPAGNRHFSRGDPTAGALFYSEFSGKFDLNVVK